jgi:hypothetical protein|tara:strand:- start:218 stop:319 length:102 start_codon:yes stop_codon:yes gene_type:complete
MILRFVATKKNRSKEIRSRELEDLARVVDSEDH